MRGILLQTLLPRFARDAVVLSWISLISAFPAHRISWRQSKKSNVSGWQTPGVCPSV